MAVFEKIRDPEGSKKQAERNSYEREAATMKVYSAVFVYYAFRVCFSGRGGHAAAYGTVFQCEEKGGGRRIVGNHVELIFEVGVVLFLL